MRSTFARVYLWEGRAGEGGEGMSAEEVKQLPERFEAKRGAPFAQQKGLCYATQHLTP